MIPAVVNLSSRFSSLTSQNYSLWVEFKQVENQLLYAVHVVIPQSRLPVLAATMQKLSL